MPPFTFIAISVTTFTKKGEGDDKKKYIFAICKELT